LLRVCTEAIIETLRLMFATRVIKGKMSADGIFTKLYVIKEFLENNFERLVSVS